MGTTHDLRDIGLLPGQSTHTDLELALAPYVQGAVEYADDHGGGKAKAAATPAPDRIVYEVPGGAVSAQLDTTAMVDGASFRLRFAADYHGPCARCLEPAVWHTDVDAHIVHDADSDDEELRSDHVDDHLNLLDVSAWAREEVGVRFPTRVLCRRDCRGLCAVCGEDLNAHPDHAHERPTDTRWDALKGLQLDGADD